MISNASAVRKEVAGLDRRIWLILAAVCLFAVLVMQEISLPEPVILAFGGMGLLSLLAVGLRSPEVPLYVLVAYLPFSRLLVGDFGTQATAFNLTNILMLWVLAAYLLKQSATRKRFFESTPLSTIIIVFSLLGAVSLIRAGWQYGSWYVWSFIPPLKRWLTPMALYFLTLWVVRDRKTIKTVTVIIMAAVAVVAVMAIRDYMYVADASFEKSRVGGIAEHSNTLGAFFVYYMFLFIGFFFMGIRRLRSWLLLIPFGLCFRGIMVTFSRGAYLAFAAGSLAAAWIRSKLLWILAVGALIFAIANPWLLPPGIRYRMGQTIEKRSSFYQQGITQSLESSAASRLDIWKGAVQMIKEHPLWGVGYGAFPHFIPRYTHGRIGRMDAHNSYLLIAAEMGIPTLLVFLLILAVCWHYTSWLYRHTGDSAMRAISLGFMAGLVGLCVANMFGSRMDAQEVAGYFWILAALVMRAVVIERYKGARGRRQGAGVRIVR